MDTFKVDYRDVGEASLKAPEVGVCNGVKFVSILNKQGKNPSRYCSISQCSSLGYRAR